MHLLDSAQVLLEGDSQNLERPVEKPFMNIFSKKINRQESKEGVEKAMSPSYKSQSEDLEAKELGKPQRQQKAPRSGNYHSDFYYNSDNSLVRLVRETLESQQSQDKIDISCQKVLFHNSPHFKNRL